LVSLVRQLAVESPALPVAAIHRQVCDTACEHGWAAPSYSTVYAIVAELGHIPAAEHRNQPNTLWWVAHVPLTSVVPDRRGRPWLTLVVDDCSGAIAGYGVFLGLSTAVRTRLALRRAILPSDDPDWPAWILVFRDGEPLGPAVDASTMKGARQFPSDTQFDDGAGITDRQVSSG
jgi:putative transposase